MMADGIDLLIAGWRHNLDFAENLLRDIPDGQRTAQPGRVVNHPAWTLAHLNHYHPAILSLVQGQPVNDPGLHPDAPRFDSGSTPVDDPAQYPVLQTLLEPFRSGHKQVEDVLRSSPPEVLAQPPGLARWAEGFGTTGRALVYLMHWHEAEHLGQIAAWRRAMGLPPLEG